MTTPGQAVERPPQPRAEAHELRRILRVIRAAAGGASEFTNRMQFIWFRADCAINDVPWDDTWQAQYGRSVRDKTMIENAALREEIGVLQAALRDALLPHESMAAVLAERHRQIAVNGWTLEHDDEHANGELAEAAAAFAVGAHSPGKAAALWPEGWNRPGFKSHRRNLVRGSAMMLAELERVDRAAAAGEPS